MPDKEERQTARRAKRQVQRGRAPTSAAGEFVREEMHHIRRGKHGARSTKQAIAIGLSKARRAGVPLKPRGGSRKTRQSAQRAYEVGQGERKPRSHSRARSRAVSRALRREPSSAATESALGSQARSVARRRGHAARSAAARKAVQTKGIAGRRAAARKAARTRARHAA